MTLSITKTSLCMSCGALALLTPQLCQAQAASTRTKDPRKEIVVTGTREHATLIKKASPIVMDIRSQQAIESLPDVNAAEALQRLPGIQMESDSGEGRFINIRGLAADLNATTYDGVRLTPSNQASPQGGSRAVAFDAFPAGILGGLEVIKSLTPEMDATGLGGVVNIRPREIGPTESLMISGMGGIGVETLNNSRRYQGNISVGVGFGGTTASGAHHVSVTLSYAYDQDQRAIHDVEADYANNPALAPSGTDPYIVSKLYQDIQARLYQYHRTRQGLSGGIVFRPSDATHFYIRGLYSGYTENAYKHEYQINNLDASGGITNISSTGDVTASQAFATEVIIATREVLGNDLLEGGGSTTLANGVKIDGKVAYTVGHDEFPYGLFAAFNSPMFSATYNDVLNVNVPAFHANGGIDLTNPAFYNTFNTGSNNRINHTDDREWSGNLNVGIPVSFGTDAMIKVGASARLRKRVATAAGASLLADPNQTYADFSQGGDQVFYGGNYNIGPTPLYDKILNLPQTPLVSNPGAYQNDKEDVYAGYVQYNGDFGPLTVVGGVRVEITDATDRVDPSQAVGSPVAKHNYTNVFPDLSLKYKLSPSLLLRGAYSTTIARPGFDQITAASSLDTTGGTPVLSTGNPGLKPTIGHNFDLAAEYYSSGGGLISADLFYDQFNNYIIPTVQRGVTNPAFTGIGNGTGEVDSFQDIGSAHAYGVELDLQQQFLFLPGWWSGFGVDANLTYVESRGALYQAPPVGNAPGTVYYGILPQTSKWAWNATAFYRKGPVDAKLAASYVSANIFGGGGPISSDIWSQPRFRLDFDISYAISKQLGVFFSAKNLTNTKLKFTQGPDARYPIQREFYQTDYMAGVRFKFGR